MSWAKVSALISVSSPRATDPASSLLMSLSKPSPSEQVASYLQYRAALLSHKLGHAAQAERGFRRVVLVGYSLGASIATHYQALRRPPEVVGEILPLPAQPTVPPLPTPATKQATSPFNCSHNSGAVVS